MISRSMLKHGYSNFSLEIFEYCKPTEVISREQYYIELLNPEYNILQKAGSCLGVKRSAETIAKFKARTLTPEQQTKRLEHSKIFNSSQEHRKRLLKYNQSKAQRVEVLDILKKETKILPSISEAAGFMGCVPGTVRAAIKYLKENGVSRLIKKRFKVNHINDKSEIV